jgi:hypothetical protein
MSLSTALRPRRAGTGHLFLALLAGAAILLPAALRAEDEPAAKDSKSDRAQHEKGDHAASLKIDVQDRDGSTVHIDLASTWLAGLIRSADVACKGDADRQAREMMRALTDQGEGGVYTYSDDDDGDRVIARRSRGALKIESTNRRGETSVVEMPWEAAQCLMLGIKPSGDLGKRLARGEAQLRFDVRDRDGRVRISIE